MINHKDLFIGGFHFFKFTVVQNSMVHMKKIGNVKAWPGRNMLELYFPFIFCEGISKNSSIKKINQTNLRD